jgi:hypothetical protein
MINLAYRAAEDIAAALHRVLPNTSVDVQSLHDRGLSRIDRTAFVGPLRSARPVDEFEIIDQEKRNASRTYVLRLLFIELLFIVFSGSQSNDASSKH